MSSGAPKRSPESEASGLDLEETELKLAPPGSGSRCGTAAAAESERKRGFSDTVELTLGCSSSEPRGDLSAVSSESKVSGAVKPPAK